MSCRSLAILVAAVGAVALSGCRDEPAPLPTASSASTAPAPNGLRLVKATVDAYRGLSRYHDRGRLVRTGEVPFELSFETHYQRPDRLRLVWARGEERGAVWAEGEEAHVVVVGRSVPGREPNEGPQTLSVALTAALVPSSGTVGQVVPLLRGGAHPLLIAKPEVVGREKVGDVSCHVVEVLELDGTKSRFWLSEADHLLRQVVDDDGKGIETTTLEVDTEEEPPSPLRPDFAAAPATSASAAPR
ncbi:MAG: hypothetical protein KC731_18990 [Myxococcales bacterium]|nr:hypothetical protein [Myxococcales bacterium]